MVDLRGRNRIGPPMEEWRLGRERFSNFRRLRLIGGCEIRDALHFALRVEEDAKASARNPGVSEPHAPGMAGHPLVERLSHIVERSELLAVVSVKDEAAIEGEAEGWFGSGPVGVSASPHPVAGNLESFLHAHAWSNAVAGPTRLHAGVLR